MSASDPVDLNRKNAILHLAEIQKGLGSVQASPSRWLREALDSREQALPRLEDALRPLDVAEAELCAPLADNLALVLGCASSLRAAMVDQSLDVADTDLGFPSGIMGDLMQGLAGAVCRLSSLPRLAPSTKKIPEGSLIDWRESDRPLLLERALCKVETGVRLVMQDGPSSLTALQIEMCVLLVLLSAYRVRAEQAS